MKITEKYRQQNNQKQDNKKALVQNDPQLLIQPLRRNPDRHAKVPVLRRNPEQKVASIIAPLPLFSCLKKHFIVAETEFPQHLQKLLHADTGSETGILKPKITVKIPLSIDITELPLAVISAFPLFSLAQQGAQPLRHLYAAQRPGLGGGRH